MDKYTDMGWEYQDPRKERTKKEQLDFERRQAREDKEARKSLIFERLNAQFLLYNVPGQPITMFERLNPWGTEAERSEVVQLSNRERIRIAIGAERVGLNDKEIDGMAKLWGYEATPIKSLPAIFTFASDTSLTYRRLPFDLAPGQHPAWDEWLSRLSDPKAYMAFIWSIFDMRHKGRQVCYLYGSAGQDGKSHTIDVIAECLGNIAAAFNGSTVSADSKFKFASVAGKRLIHEANCQNTAILQSEFIHNISGGDTVSVEAKNKDAISVKLYSRIIIASNMPPVISGGGYDTSRLLYIQVAPHKGPKDDLWKPALIRELPQFLYACREMYLKLCPLNMTIQVNDVVKEATSNLEQGGSDIGNEYLWELLNRGYVPHPTMKLLASEIWNYLRLDPVQKAWDIHRFKNWMSAHHNVNSCRMSDNCAGIIGLARRK